MAKEDLDALAERLFTTFLAPLVLGGPMRPGKLVGGKRALSFGPNARPADVELLSRTELARVRIARTLCPIDTLDGAPREHEWALAAVLHDIVQSTHPDLDAAFRRSGPRRILDVAEKTLDRVPSPVNVADALSRHTWFSRMFDLTRSDIELHWWTGSARFIGTEPPKRLMLWPELRRLKESRTARALMDLPTNDAVVDADRFNAVVGMFVRKSPLTDLASVTRTAPAFVRTHENLAFCSTRAGRTLATRALALLPSRDVDRALGRATRRLFSQKAARAILVATLLLRDRALRAATLRLGQDRPEPLASGTEQDDAAFANGIGALAASYWLTHASGGFAETERRSLLELFAPAANAVSTPEIRALLS